DRRVRPIGAEAPAPAGHGRGVPARRDRGRARNPLPPRRRADRRAAPRAARSGGGRPEAGGSLGMNDALTQVLPTLWRWRSSLAGPQQPVNSYVWRTADGCVLIDPAGDLTPAELGRLDLGPVRAILVTHVQAEHVAGCRHWPAVPVHV